MIVTRLRMSGQILWRGTFVACAYLSRLSSIRYISFSVSPSLLVGHHRTVTQKSWNVTYWFLNSTLNRNIACALFCYDCFTPDSARAVDRKPQCDRPGPSCPGDSQAHLGPQLYRDVRTESIRSNLKQRVSVLAYRAKIVTPSIKQYAGNIVMLLGTSVIGHLDVCAFANFLSVLLALSSEKSERRERV